MQGRSCVSSLLAVGRGGQVAPSKHGEGARSGEMNTLERGMDSLWPCLGGSAGWMVPLERAPHLLLVAGLLTRQATGPDVLRVPFNIRALSYSPLGH